MNQPACRSRRARLILVFSDSMTRLLYLLPLALAACSAPRPDARALVDSATARIERRDYAAAMSIAAEALDAAPDSATASEACVLIADCHSAAGNHAAAMAFARRAADLDSAARSVFVKAATAAGRPHDALAELALVHPADSSARVEYLRLFAAPAIATGRHDEAFDALRSLHADSVWLPVELRARLACEYLRRGLPDSAARVIPPAAIDRATTPADFNALADYFEAARRPGEALEAVRRMASQQDSLLSASMAADIYNRLYNIEHARRVGEETRTRRNALLWAAGVALLAAVAVVAFLLQRAASRRRLLEAENRVLLAWREVQASREQSRDTISRLFRDSYDSLELAANLLIDGTATARVVRQLTAKVDSCRSPEFLNGLEKAVNECYDDAIARLRQAVCLNQADLTTALYCAAGLSPRVVCLLLDCTPSALYNRKYRLKTKIHHALLSEAERTEFLSIIS